MSNRVVFIHGNGTTHWSFAWAPWLQAELDAAGFETFFETMPDSVIARAEYWLPFLTEHVRVASNDIIVGWSSGAVAAMRFAETNQLAGSVLVSPCYTDLGDDLERQSGYYDKPWDWNAIRANQRAITLITGTDDPFIPQSEFATIAEELQPNWIQIESGGHFIDRTKFDEVLQSVFRMDEHT